MLIYISGPYRGEVEKNIEEARQVAVKLWEMGHAVICPHTNTAHFEQYSKVTPEQYIEGDLNMVSRCDAVVALPAWVESEGAKRELAYAKDLGVPIYYPSDPLPALHPTEIRCPEQAQAFREILGQMYRTHLDKNADYSPANILATGELGLITRLWDKVARLMNLAGFRFRIEAPGTLEAGRTPKNEAIEDTYQDAAVYAIIGLLLRRGKWGR